MFNAHVRQAISLAAYKGGQAGATGFYSFHFSQGQNLVMHATFRLNTAKINQINIVKLNRIVQACTQRQDVTAALNQATGQLSMSGNVDIVGNIPHDLFALGLMGDIQKNTLLITQEAQMQGVEAALRGYLGTQRDGTIPSVIGRS